MISPFAFNVLGARFQRNDVLLAQLQFGRIFNRNDPLVVGNITRKNIEQGRFTGAGAARDYNVQAAL